MAETDLGFVITAINNKPQKFKVTALELRANSLDLYNLIPLQYNFLGTGQNITTQNINFCLEMTKMVKTFYFKTDEEMHNAAIKYALISIRNKPDLTIIRLTRAVSIRMRQIFSFFKLPFFPHLVC